MSKKASTIQEIRSSYLEFFRSKDHQIIPSASLLPAEDPTLLFTTAGMVPFKDFFASIRRPPHPRLASVQKCLRTTDLEEVGKTLRHLSFFEMLGNFSFGNYFKKEAIEFAWEYSTNHLPFLPEQIWITIYNNDDEAYDLWHRHIGVPANRIVRLGDKDNFWGPAGATGACGPCSELYLDRGPEYKCASDDCKPGDDGDRFMEFWNLVFNQFNKNPAGEFEKLKFHGIDTGAGLERLATLVQGVDSVYDTDELRQLRDEVARIYQASYTGDAVVPIRVLTDHARSLSFAMADGIYPSNESRGYVLRRMLRRGLMFGRKLGQKEPLMYKLVDKVNEIYADFYPELKNSRELTAKYLQSEESRFLQTLDAGASKMDELLQKAADNAFTNQTIPGKEAFLLYDTFGFPLEMTVELAENRGVQVDIAGFQAEMEQQRERGRRAWKGGEQALPQLPHSETVFTGYGETKSQAELLYIVLRGQTVHEISESEIGKDEPFMLVFNRTPFYAESGGQSGDTGHLEAGHARAVVIDTRKNGDSFVHLATGLEGRLVVKDQVTLSVDENRRQALARHHSSTHLLNAALRRQLGTHVRQSGSQVAEESLRFDFTHPAAMSDSEISQVELAVNEAIEAALPVVTDVLPKSEAEKMGAVMAFGEKYGDTVRVVTMGDENSALPSFSREFCGGTHVSNTRDLGFFVIVKEASPGAGNRRIEAVSGQKALQQLAAKKEQLLARIEAVAAEPEFRPAAGQLQNQLQAPASGSSAVTQARWWETLKNLEKSVLALEAELKKSRKKSEKSATAVDAALLDTILAGREACGKYQVVSYRADGLGIPVLKQLADSLRERDGQLLVLLAATEEERWNFVCAATRQLAEQNQLDLSAVMKEVLASQNLQGSGGGKKELSQASGKGADSSALDSFLAAFRKKLAAL